MEPNRRKSTSGTKSGNILYNFFDQIKRDMGIHSDEIFLSLIASHYKRESKYRQLGFINNLKYALLSSTYSFKTFLRALSVLDVVKFEMSLTLTKKRGEVSIHKFTADLGASIDDSTDENTKE